MQDAQNKIEVLTEHNQNLIKIIADLSRLADKQTKIISQDRLQSK